MDPTLLAALAVAVLGALDLAPVRWGRDSRRRFDSRRDWW